VGLFKAPRLLPLVLKPRSDALVKQLACMQRKVAVLNHHVRQALIEIRNLRYFGNRQQLCEMLDLRANRKVIVSQCV
jgi:hypothetical protein